MNSKIWPTFLLILVLGGCDIQDKPPSHKEAGMFLGYTTDGRFFRLNTVDGTLAEYSEGRLVAVPSGRTRLVVGEIYEDESDLTSLF